MKKSALALSEIGLHLEEIIFLVDSNKKVCYCNKDMANYFGANNELFSPDFIENNHQKVFQLSACFYDLARSAASDETRYQTASINEVGEKVTIEWKTIPVHSDPSDKSATFLLIGKDISEECSKNEKIDDLEIQLNSIIEIMAGNYWWKDVNGVYKGFNHALLKLLGVSREEVVGHTDYDLPWANTADELIKNDQRVITSGLPHKTEEEIKSASGEIRYFDIFKIPLKNKKGEVIGTIGNSIDITERKQAEAKAKTESEEAQRLKLENERQQIALEEKEKFAQLARKVAHDINSPLSALKMMIPLCDELPEDKRLSLNRATESIWDIANNLLSNFRQQKKKTITSEVEPRQPLLVSDLLIQLLSEKKVQYRNQSVSFTTIIAPDAQFAFIQCQAIEFRRAMSNLINNAVDALESKTDGTVTVQLTVYAGTVVIEVADNGFGMPSIMVEKMRQRQSFTSGKESGHGLGLQQIWDTLEYNEGEMDVQSVPRQGTAIRLTFAIVVAPGWIAQEIHLTANSIILILDDDGSIHAAWNLRFASFLTSYPNLRIHHFTQGQETLDFLAELKQKEKDNVIFLSDYELLHQNRNGLEIIEASAINHSVLVTSYYSNLNIREKTDLMGIKVLPKQMASVIPIYLS